VRTLAAVGLAALLGASSLAAQYERRYEVGMFGAFTKYDKAFALEDKIGGGVRFAYALGPALSLEVEALFQPPHTIAPSTDIEPVIGGGSLVFNALNRDRLSVYLLAGYSRLDFGGTNTYRFTDGGVHAGAGTRFFFSDRVALRVEGRGIHTPETNGAFGQKAATHIVGSVGFARVGLGVHYVSDVVAGWVLGLGWLAATTAAFRAWRREEGDPRTPASEGLDPDLADGDAVGRGVPRDRAG